MSDVVKHSARLFRCWPSFLVSDLGASVAYFRDKLGFEVSYQIDDPPFATLSRDNLVVLLRRTEQPVAGLANQRVEPSEADVYIQVSDVDQLHAELRERGADVLSEPTTRPYEHRDFAVRLPDGYLLLFWNIVEQTP